MKLFAIAGSPVLQSQSPQIWNYCFKKKNIDAHYFRISSDTAKDVASMIHEMGLVGCNITSPLKESILSYINKIEGDAAKIKTLNCVVPIGKKLSGYNTDVDGCYSSLVLNGFNPHNKKIVIIGAGGAAKAVVYALLKNGASDVVIANRTYEKARELAEMFKCRVCYIDKIESETKDADLLVSCVSTLERVIKKEAIHKKLIVFDAKYTGISVLKKDAEFAGCKIIDGKEWLVYQGALFFKDFFDELPVDDMKEALKLKPPKNINSKNISLIGFMGTGKSTLGKALAYKMKYKFIDVDLLIGKKEGKKISDIFNNNGEEYFRNIESQTISNIDFSIPSIISCGGGAIISKDNVDIICSNSKVVWMWNDMDDIKKRITGEGRPMFKDAATLFSRRIPLYAKACDVCINNKEEKSTLKQILKEIEI